MEKCVQKLLINLICSLLVCFSVLGSANNDNPTGSNGKGSCDPPLSKLAGTDLEGTDADPLASEQTNQNIATSRWLELRDGLRLREIFAEHLPVAFTDQENSAYEKALLKIAKRYRDNPAADWITVILAEEQLANRARTEFQRLQRRLGKDSGVQPDQVRNALDHSFRLYWNALYKYYELRCSHFWDGFSPQVRGELEGMAHRLAVEVLTASGHKIKHIQLRSQPRIKSEGKRAAIEIQPSEELLGKIAAEIANPTTGPSRKLIFSAAQPVHWRAEDAAITPEEVYVPFTAILFPTSNASTHLPQQVADASKPGTAQRQKLPNHLQGHYYPKSGDPQKASVAENLYIKTQNARSLLATVAQIEPEVPGALRVPVENWMENLNAGIIFAQGLIQRTKSMESPIDALLKNLWNHSQEQKNLIIFFQEKDDKKFYLIAIRRGPYEKSPYAIAIELVTQNDEPHRINIYGDKTNYEGPVTGDNLHTMAENLRLAIETNNLPNQRSSNSYPFPVSASELTWRILLEQKRRIGATQREAQLTLGQMLDLRSEGRDFLSMGAPYSLYPSLESTLSKLELPSLSRKTLRHHPNGSTAPATTRPTLIRPRGIETISMPIPFGADVETIKGTTAKKRNGLIENVGMDTVISNALSQGHGFRDVSKDNVGHDVVVKIPRTGEVLHVEVKGKLASQKTVTLSRNEMLAAQSDPRWVLAIVRINDDGTVSLHYRQRLPLGVVNSPALRSASFDIKHLLENSDPIDLK